MDENALLVETKVVLSSELDKQSTLVNKQVKELNEYHQLINQLTSDLHQVKQSNGLLEQERNEAAKHALQLSDLLGQSEETIDSLRDQLLLIQSQCKEKEQKVVELEGKCKVLSSRYDSDSVAMVQTVKSLEDRMKEMQYNLHNKQGEVENSVEMLRKLRSEYNTTRQDAEGMLQVMNGMERQLQEYASREAVVNALQSEAREKLEQAITLREECVVKEEQSTREVERLLSERKLSLQTRQVIQYSIWYDMIWYMVICGIIWYYVV